MVMTHFLRIGNAETKVEIGSFVGKSANLVETGKRRQQGPDCTPGHAESAGVRRAGQAGCHQGRGGWRMRAEGVPPRLTLFNRLITVQAAVHVFEMDEGRGLGLNSHRANRPQSSRTN